MKKRTLIALILDFVFILAAIGFTLWLRQRPVLVLAIELKWVIAIFSLGWVLLSAMGGKCEMSKEKKLSQDIGLMIGSFGTMTRTLAALSQLSIWIRKRQN
jgi:hypothetical protein